MSESSLNELRQEWLSKAGILTEALPFMRRYSGKTVAVKFGGHAMGDDELFQSFAADMVLMKQVGMNPIVVHGGGPQIGKMLERLAIKSEFIDGLRVTDSATVEIVEMVLSGSINKSIVAAINAAGGRAIGISGKDGNLITARKLQRTKIDPDSNIEKVLDLGFVGEPESVDVSILKTFAEGGLIPVIAPIGFGEDGETYNINADTSAGAIASASDAARFLLLTDVAGVLDKNGNLIPELSVVEARNLIEDGTISGGMIPKIETCIDAVENGARAAVIFDGRVPHACLVELFTPHGVGTIIRG
ncbi:acetylglutamate kinase [uncultured Nisaea sp.]|jgi:acetylglutamate kinase|uniref:acetylglutamate kinase n=1 Tax=uncultured Nisaea sp. TaxID=538215 RepID=UPI0030ED3142|tara:strand:+ start:1265 stop:2173 length:909 start_codon:yes stop_codon:yes gene_type:complete